jgi:hypothetical protein
MKVYVVTETSDNGQQYEDYREYTSVVGVYASEELANKAISLLPTTVPTDYQPVYEYTDEYPDGAPALDENGCIKYEPISYTSARYYVHVQELVEQ